MYLNIDFMCVLHRCCDEVKQFGKSTFLLSAVEAATDAEPAVRAALCRLPRLLSLVGMIVPPVSALSQPESRLRNVFIFCRNACCFACLFVVLTAGTE